jgi:hypothetical protein
MSDTKRFRREDGEWKVVHRRADPIDDSADLLSGLREEQ